MVLLLAVACGVTVANMNYAQPLLEAIARFLDVSKSAADLTVTISQLGFALGLAFVVPPADLVNRRRLVVGTQCVTAAALLGVATAPNLVVLCMRWRISA